MSTKLKEAQDKVRELSMKSLAIAESSGMPASQMKGALDRLEPEIKHWVEEVRALQFVAEQVKAFEAVTEGGTATYGSGYKAIGNAPSLDLTEQQAHEIYAALKAGQRSRVEFKAPTDFTGQPATLLPGIVARQHEPVRILDHIPSTPMPGPSIEFVSHTSTVGAAATVARGGLKPEVTLGITQQILTARKIACWASVPDELLLDFSTFVGYLSGELRRVIIDAENSQVLSGDGLGENLTGLLTTTGAITRAQVVGATALDTLEQAISDLRVGPAYADADAVVLNPRDWSLIRRAKDSQGRYLVGDPINGAADTLWGTPVLPTTSMPAGTGLVANLAMAATAFIRQGPVMDTTNSSGTDFQYNITKFRIEQRLALGVQRPAALCKVTGLA